MSGSTGGHGSMGEELIELGIEGCDISLLTFRTRDERLNQSVLVDDRFEMLNLGSEITWYCLDLIQSYLL